METKPLVSCLCVTRNDIALLERAIRCYNEQSYNNKELIILCEDNNDYLAEIQERYASEKDIVVVIVPASPKITLGELRNRSILAASGKYICQWDDDDWYHPDRINSQYSFVIESGSSGCYLDQRILYDAWEKQLYMSNPCKFEGSVFMERALALRTPMYSSKNTAEDTDFIYPLIDSGALKPLHAPHLYVYTYHGNNAWHREHFEEIFRASRKIINKNLVAELSLRNVPEIGSNSSQKNLICIYTCHKNAKSLALLKETNWYKTTIANKNNTVYSVYADLSIDKEYILNKENNTLVVKAEENYAKLSLKTYQMIKACVEFQNFDYLIKVDSTVIDEARFSFKYFEEKYYSENFYKEYGGIKHWSPPPTISGIARWAKEKGIDTQPHNIYATDQEVPSYYDGKCYVVDFEFCKYISENGEVTAKLLAQHMAGAEDHLIAIMHKKYKIGNQK